MSSGRMTKPLLPAIVVARFARAHVLSASEYDSFWNEYAKAIGKHLNDLTIADQKAAERELLRCANRIAPSRKADASE